MVRWWIWRGGFGGGHQAPSETHPPMTAHPLGQVCPQPGSPGGASGPLLPGQRAPRSAPFDPLGSPILMLPLVPWGGDSGEWGPLSPGCPPTGVSCTHTVSSPDSTSTDRQQCLHRPGAGEAARVPALHHPGWEAPPREALAQGWPARECRAPLGAGEEGAVTFTPRSLLCSFPVLECPLPSCFFQNLL